MAITVTFNEYNGSAATATEGVTDLAFGAYDGSGIVTSDYPIHAGHNSFVKYIKAAFTGFGGETVGTTRIWLSSGSLKTGETLTMEGLGPVTYAQPTTEATGDSAIPTADPTTQNVALAGADDGELTANGTSDYIRLQRCCAATTPNGKLNALTFTFGWTES